MKIILALTEFGLLKYNNCILIFYKWKIIILLWPYNLAAKIAILIFLEISQSINKSINQ